MHARVTRFKARLERADEGARIFQQGIPPIRDLKGFKDAVLLLDRASGQAMTIAVWADEQTMQDSASAVASLFEQAAHTIDGQPRRQVYEVVEHRPGRDRAFARLSTGTVHPSWFERPADTAIIDAASQQPGYAGFLIIANRANNSIMGMSFWDSREHLDASESGYYTREMDKSRDQFAGGQWTREIYEVVAQA